SGYQATRWGGETSKAFGAANAARVESTRASALSNALSEVDVATFTSWAVAFIREETELADFYEARFREEFVPAFEAWLATDPLNNPEAPPTPFVLPEYVVAAGLEADELSATAEARSAEARRNVQRQSNYVLGVVLFASALFFAGLTKVSKGGARLAVLGIGSAIFLGTLVWIATFPVSLTV
ncbi:MAG TPA: hypothetical protein VFZ12_06775, partial [Dehalococcoidia bacterium]|nr:hypothetical protein [Dehalococcoidia bacterium]